MLLGFEGAGDGNIQDTRLGSAQHLFGTLYPMSQDKLMRVNHTQAQSRTFKRTTSLELSTWYMGILLTNLVEKKDSNGTFSLLEATLAPGNEPPPHVHSREDELFYVLEGEFDVYVGEEAFNVKTGECIFLPKFKPHGFVIRSPRLSVLILYTPGGVEEAFRRMSSPAQNLEPPTEALTYSQSDVEQTARRFGEYGVQILTPDEVAEQLPLYPKPLIVTPIFGKTGLPKESMDTDCGVGPAIDELPFAAAGDQPGFAQDFEMVRDGCGGHATHRHDLATARTRRLGPASRNEWQ